MTENRLTCTASVMRGDRQGLPCGKTAVAVVTSPIASGEFVCGIHRRGWLPTGLARIAYWSRKDGAWT